MRPQLAWLTGLASAQHLLNIAYRHGMRCSTMSIWAPAVWMEQWFVMVPAPFVLAEGSGEYFCTLSMR
ncbi:hypothetical protein PG995_004595 [Apiospora arundinis]